MNPTLWAFLICIAAAALEGMLAGSGARERLAQLRMPAFSPPFAVWLVIGFLFYAMCFVILRHLLASNGLSLAVLLLMAVLLANVFWNILFFRWRNLYASFIAFIAYAIVVAALAVVLLELYPVGAVLVLCYGVYLIYAMRWSYQLWRLNTPQTADRSPGSH